MIAYWRNYVATVLLFLGLCQSPVLHGAGRSEPTLSVEITGVESDLRKNVEAWLGAPPQTPQARSNYLHAVRDKVTRSLQALGYYRPQIDMKLDRKASPWELTIAIEAGEPVRLREVDITLSGEGGDDAALVSLKDKSALTPGNVLNHGEYETTRRKIASLAQQRGYFEGAYETSRVEVAPEAGTADVSLHYRTGPRYAFGAMRYDQDMVTAELLEPLFTIEEGEPYQQAELAETQAQLQRTGYFSTVLVRPDLDAADAGSVPLDVSLYPANRHAVDLGIGFSTDTRERLSVTWRTPRVNRYGHSQETRLQYSRINPSGRFTYKIPLGHPLNDVLQLRARVENNEYGDLDSDQIELGVRREKKRMGWVYSYGVRGLNESWSARGIDRESDYLLPGFSMSRRTREGSLLNPSSGFSQLYELEVANSDLGSDVDLVRLSANFGYIRSIGARSRLVLRSGLGTALISDGDRDDLAPSLNFFAGGNESLRGYSYQSIGNEASVITDSGEVVRVVLGGERLLTGSVEYQYSVTDSWRAAVFLDAGDAFDEGDFDLNVGAGFGIHYVTQVGAVRVELANPVTDDDPSWRLHVSVGAEF